MGKISDVAGYSSNRFRTPIPNGSGKEIESLIKSYTDIEIHKTERKWYQKILGFRSGNKVKMVIASLIYVFIIGSIFNTIINKKEDQKTNQEVAPTVTTNTAPVKEEPKPEQKTVEQPVDKKHEKISKFKEDTQKRLTNTYKSIDGLNPNVSISEDGKLITFAFDLDAYAKHDKVDKELSVSTFKTSAGPYEQYKGQAYRAYGKEANIVDKKDIVVKIVDSSNNQVVIDNVESYTEQPKKEPVEQSKKEENSQKTEQNNKQNVETDVVYDNCKQVKQAGKAPIRQGEPGYSAKLDRDGDGIACDK
ncbi:excalibur calcium-binding domain-containing protein [Bacillus bingmayongensis]|uniref:excalibur calcium-binding domain-containing protein n=1 Tax=Bacillus bingmayongensis TaxID=1150157 RepID=UPI001C8DE262|nr:excalibur calcium-binding domain-containing protein [Bacillus bingmayongensis]MBY0597663.1 excalibur calcium-binding domain-containing protein [Bacillus bingmayongensis]